MSLRVKEGDTDIPLFSNLIMSGKRQLFGLRSYFNPHSRLFCPVPTCSTTVARAEV
jgi:hypothetical protein